MEIQDGADDDCDFESIQFEVGHVLGLELRRFLPLAGPPNGCPIVEPLICLALHLVTPFVNPALPSII